jgi:hypothetical protein
MRSERVRLLHLSTASNHKYALLEHISLSTHIHTFCTDQDLQPALFAAQTQACVFRLYIVILGTRTQRS